MEIWHVVVILVATSVGATVHASVGLGIGLVAGPALVIVDPAFVPGPLILATLALTLRHLIRDGRQADRGTVVRAFRGVPFGLGGGLVVAASTDDGTMRVVVGGAIVVAAALLLLGVRISRTSRTDVIGGVAFSFSLITAAIPGPAAAVAFNDLDPSTYRGTMGFIGVPVGLLSMILLVMTDAFGRDELELTGRMMPGILVGLTAAGWARPYLDRSWFRPALLWLALLGGAAVVVRQLV